MTFLDFFKVENYWFKFKVKSDLVSNYYKKDLIVISSLPIKRDTNRFTGVVKFVFKDSKIESKIFV